MTIRSDTKTSIYQNFPLIKTFHHFGGAQNKTNEDEDSIYRKSFNCITTCSTLQWS
jgi:hypothetical protein